jgi:PAS domain S-box-containing protein
LLSNALAGVFDAILEPIVLVDALGSIAYVNRVGSALFGYAPGEIDGRPVETLLPTDKREQHLRHRRAFLVSEQTRAMAGRELVALRKDGEILPVEVGLGHFYDGSTRYAVAAIRDLTARRRADNILRDSEQQLRLALEGADLGLWDWNAASGRLIVNDRWLTMLGLDPQGPEPTLELWLSLVHAEDRPSLRRLIDEASGNPAARQFEFEIRARRSDARNIWILTKGTVVAREPGRSSVHIVGTHLDITARKAAETELREAEQRLHAVIDASPVPFILEDVHGTTIFANPAFEATFGYRLAEVAKIEDWWTHFYPDPEYRRLATRKWAEQAELCLRTGEPSAPFEAIMRGKNGADRIIVAHAVPLARGKAPLFLVVLFDVTEQRRLETGLLEATSREQHRLGMDLHDGLGQQLTGLSLMLSALSRSVGRQPLAETQASLADLARHAGECVAMTRSIAHGLSPVASGPGAFERALHRLAESTTRLGRMGVTLALRGLAGMTIDPATGDSVYRIVQEALANASRHGNATQATIAAELTGSQIVVTVSDNGCGLSGAKRTDGMGLSIMRYRARALGGHLEIHSPPSGGTVVRCECPVRAGVEPETA